MSASADYAVYWDFATQNEGAVQYSHRVQGPGARTVPTTTYASVACCAARGQLHLSSTPFVSASSHSAGAQPSGFRRIAA